MKKTWQIAKLELSLLFYSPIAWLLMIVLLFQLAVLFTSMLGIYQQTQELLRQLHRAHSFLTIALFTKTYGGTISQLTSSLYLYLPLITMGLISRETSSGTIKLLYSSPLRVQQIIFGKFAAMLVYNLVIIGIITLVVIGGAVTISHFDYPMVISALIGVYLLLCAYSAIGLFMSSLTSYQVVAAICTLAVFAILNFIGSMWQGVDFVRDLTYCMSMPGRTEKMIGGLLTTRDVIYFLVIVYIFLALAISKLRMARDSRSVYFKISRFSLIVISGLLIGYLTSRPRYIGYYDATDTKLNTLSKNTQNILKDMGDDPIEVTEYVNFFDATYYKAVPEFRNQDVDRWESYLRFKPNINIKWVYYYDSVPDPGLYLNNPGKSLKEIFEKNIKFSNADPDDYKTPEEIHKLVDLRGENNRLVMELKYKNKRTFLRVFDDSEFWPGETEIAAALKRMMVTLPRIVFVNDGYERSINKLGDRDYKMLTNLKTFRHALINQGFDVDTLSLTTAEIPAGIAALVIADPRVDFDTATLAKVKKFVNDGGNLLVAGEGSKKMLNNNLLNMLGVQMMDGSLVQRSKDYSFNLVTPALTSTGAALSLQMKYVHDDNIPVSMPGVSGLLYDRNSSFDVHPLLMTAEENSWNKKGQLVLDSANLVYAPMDGDQKGAFPTALSLTRKVNGKEQRIIVSGDADFLSNAELGRNNLQTANFHFANAIFGWFAHEEFPVATTRPKSRDNDLLVSSTGVKVIKVIYLGIIPGILILLGTVLLIRRKRK